MRISSIFLKERAGLDLVDVSDLSDVVVIAGPNGVGKTRFIRDLMGIFREPIPIEALRLCIEATSDSELRDWQKKSIWTTDAADAQKLQSRLQKTQRRNRYRSTVLNFDSDRAITQVKPFPFQWDIADPYEEDIGWDISYSFLRDRFQDVQHSLFKLVEGQRRKIAKRAVELQSSGATSMPLDFPDPLAVYKAAFSQLLAPKVLLEPDLRRQQLLYELDGQALSIDTLSSGEREVVNIVFDFLLRNPSDCIVFFDEPELHLHPELSYKLLQTLSTIGKRN